MAHANIINNKYVDDRGLPATHLPLSQQAEASFRAEIAELELQGNHVPPGWLRHFKDAIRMLKAVDCPQRNGIELSNVSVLQGQLRVWAIDANDDAVVSGILKRLQKRSACTCQICGRSYSTAYREQAQKTLCAKCAVQAELAHEIELWLGDNWELRRRTQQPLIEFDKLPVTIQQLIPSNARKRLHLSVLEKPVLYVQPSAIKAKSDQLSIIKRYFDLQKGTLH